MDRNNVIIIKGQKTHDDKCELFLFTNIILYKSIYEHFLPIILSSYLHNMAPTALDAFVTRRI